MSQNRNRPIGIIIPPSQIKSNLEQKEYADKTAQFVAQKGSGFQNVVWEKQNNNPKFIFLKNDNPYRPYYDYMITQYSKELIEKYKAEANIQILPKIIQAQQKKIIEQINFKQVKPPDQPIYYAQIPKLSLLQLDIIKHTAQSVAKNGKNFLIALNEREKNNPQFQFLKNTSDYNLYFNTLVQAYIRCIHPKKQDINKITNLIKDKQFILQRCKEHYEYEKLRQQKHHKLTSNQPQKQFQIDWNDFQLVQTIDFDENNQKNNYNQKKFQAPSVNYKTNNIRISVLLEKQIMKQICPSCKQQIPYNLINQHLKLCISIVYNKNNNKQSTQPSNSVADYGQIQTTLISMKSNRPDIFGQSQISKVQKSKINKQWDGQNASITRTSGNLAMLAKQHERNLQEHLKALQKKKQ